MVTENCKKIEPVVVKLCSKTYIPLFSEHGVYDCARMDGQTKTECLRHRSNSGGSIKNTTTAKYKGLRVGQRIVLTVMEIQLDVAINRRHQHVPDGDRLMRKTSVSS